MNRYKLLNIAKTYFKSVFYSILPKRTVPLWTHLWVTRRCNLRCKYCYVSHEKYPEMNTIELKKAIKHIKEKLHCSFIALMGGEPTIRKDLPEIIQYMTDLNITSFLTTNGTLLDERKIFQLCESDVDFIELSLDGMSPSPISEKTGQNLMNILEILIKYTKTYDVGLSINMVITKQNYKELYELIRLVSGEPISITTGLYIPDLQDEKNILDDPFAFISSEDLINLDGFVNRIINLKNKGAFLAMDDSYYKKWVPFMRELLKRPPQKPKKLWKCKAGKNFLEIDCDGRIRYCSYLNQLVDEDLTIIDLDLSYYHQLGSRFKNMLKRCNNRCLSNCFYQVSLIKNHPFKFADEFVFKHAMPFVYELFDREKTSEKMALKNEWRKKFNY
ncbi:MAG: hypothetical protein BAJALOKI3v1_1010005 [Promethearchaeota archaeon]|nr:MAG: hypothetical protein BAJALOKI3v1_1010005 [Candidatus Lokiarchaeota archaeon]